MNLNECTSRMTEKTDLNVSDTRETGQVEEKREQHARQRFEVGTRGEAAKRGH